MDIILDVINAIFYGLYVVVMSFVYFIGRQIATNIEGWFGVLGIALAFGVCYLIYLGIKEIYKAMD